MIQNFCPCFKDSVCVHNNTQKQKSDENEELLSTQTNEQKWGRPENEAIIMIPFQSFNSN